MKKFSPNKLKNISITVIAYLLLQFLTGCSQISGAINSILAEDTFPKLPPPEITTYVLDLSGSTNPIAQLNALNSGIDEFTSGKSLGNPFTNPKIKPRGLSMQFITRVSGQAPRFLIVSAEASQELYGWLLENSANIDQAEPLWNGFVRAREIIYRDKLFEDTQCSKKTIDIFGQQALSVEALRFPASQICRDAMRTARSLEALNKFNQSPGIAMGSDVFGAIHVAVNNMKIAGEQFANASSTIAIASDMVDENDDRKLKESLASPGIDSCKLGRQYSHEDFGDQFTLSKFKIILIGLSNTSMYGDLIKENRKFWICYFEEAGAVVEEASDLAGY